LKILAWWQAADRRLEKKSKKGQHPSMLTKKKHCEDCFSEIVPDEA
jgi:hypothetical protein